MQALRAGLAAFALAIASGAWAQATPVGLWKTVDDDSGAERSWVRIVETPKGLSGRIEKVIDPDAKPDDVCDKCSDDRKSKPIKGLEIIRGGAKSGGNAYWDGGHILDPENGKEYRFRLTPMDGGRKLQVRGYIGPFYRNQEWIRIE